jgi:Na+/phosphate symporter
MSKIKKMLLDHTVWLLKARFSLGCEMFGLIGILFIGNSSITKAVSPTEPLNHLQEIITMLCLWLGSSLFLIGVPGAFFAYLHDARNKKRRLRWLPIMDGVLLLGLGLIFLSTPIAQLFSSTVVTNLLGKR